MDRVIPRLMPMELALVLMTVPFPPYADEHCSTENGTRSLTVEERTACLRSVECVHYDHLLCPKPCRQSRPSLEESLTPRAARDRAEDILRQSAAQSSLWERGLTGKELQAEMDRMARTTLMHDRMEELFAAPDHDPHKISECLARPILAENTLRALYDRDPRFHGALRRRAEAEWPGVGAGGPPPRRVPPPGGRRGCRRRCRSRGPARGEGAGGRLDRGPHHRPAGPTGRGRLLPPPTQSRRYNGVQHTGEVAHARRDSAPRPSR